VTLVVCMLYYRLPTITRYRYTGIVGSVAREEPVENVVVTLETRLLVRHPRFFKQICLTNKTVY